MTHALHDTACAEQVWNEQQMAQAVREPACRVWDYGAPAVVLGCSQRRLLATACHAGRLPLLLRGSGGGAVLVGPWMVGLSVALPSEHELAGASVVASYRWLGELLAGLLQDAGIDADALSPHAARAVAPASGLDWACFAGLSPWEVVAGGRKIAGLAQVRRRQGVLLVGGVLLDEPDWPLLCSVLHRPAAEAQRLAQCTTSWAQQGGPPMSRSRFAQVLQQRLQVAIGLRQASNAPAPEPA